MNDNTSFAFNRRYLVIGVLTYILSAYIALDSEMLLTAINAFRFMVYTAVFICILLSAYIMLRIILRKKREARSLCTASFLVILIFILSFTRCCFFIRTINTQSLIISQAERIEGIITTEPTLSSSGKSYALNIDVHRAITETTTVTFEKPCKALYFVSTDAFDTSLSPGESIVCSNRLPIDSPAAFEGGLDYPNYLKQDKIVGAVYTDDAASGSILKEKSPVFSALKSISLKIRGAVLASTEIDSYNADEKALLQGILVGNTVGFSDSLYKSYTDSGFIHITSVSGMHTSYLFMALSVLLGLVRFPKRGVCLISIPVLILFAAVAMFTPSVCRAVIMMIILLLASVFRRNNDSITALSVAALLLSFDNPYCLQSYSFLLSFGATLGILIYYPLLSERLSFAIIPISDRNRGHFRKMLYKLNKFSVNSVCLSLGGTIGLGYFMMRFFNKLQWGGIVGNILIFPLTAISFIGGYANSIIYYMLRPAAEVIAKYILNPMLSATNFLAKLFSAGIFRFNTPTPPKSFFVVYVFICVVLYYLLLPSKKEN